MADEKWWDKEGEKKPSSKEEVQEMMNHTEMMEIKREEEMAQAQAKIEFEILKYQPEGNKLI